MSKSAGASVKKETQNAQTGYDPGSMEYQRKVWEAAQRAGQAGPSDLTTGAAGYNTDLMNAGNLGLGALSGDPNAAKQLMNPYQQQVIDATNQQWNQNDQQTTMGVNDQATRAGAFGGGRHGVAEGTALAQNNLNRNAQVSGLLSSGYNNTMDRAAQLAQGGFNAAGQNANLGMGGVGSPDQWMLEMLRRGWSGPTGQTSSGASTGFGANTQVGFHLPGQ